MAQQLLQHMQWLQDQANSIAADAVQQYIELVQDVIETAMSATDGSADLEAADEVRQLLCSAMILFYVHL